MADEFCDICGNVVKIGVAAQRWRTQGEGNGGTAGVLGERAGKGVRGLFRFRNRLNEGWEEIVRRC